MTRWLSLALGLALFVVACEKDEQPLAGNARPAASVPRISLSAQPWRSGGNVGALPSSRAPIATDGSEVAAGHKAHALAAKACKDDKCMGEKCGTACTSWVSEPGKSFRSVNHKNVVYFNCFGACLAGPGAGAK